MPAPKNPNTAAATEASVAARGRKADERLAERLRSRGWACIPPEALETACGSTACALDAIPENAPRT